MDRNKLWKILKEMGIPDHLICSSETCMQVKKQQLEPDMEQQTGSKLGKEYVKAVYCHLAYLTCMQSTSCEMLGWMKHKLESRLQGEISITSDMQMTSPLWQKHLVPSLHGKQMGKQWKQCQTLFLGAPQSLQMVTAAMKLKDAYSLEGKL